MKVLLFFDVGGSMDWHIKMSEELFSAARTEFKHMEYFYFHNCLYESVWRENRRRWQETTPTWDVLHTYPHDYKVIFVGDASMPRMRSRRRAARWSTRTTRRARLDAARDADLSARGVAQPGAGDQWEYTASIRMVRQLMGGRMYPLTLEGLDPAMRELVR